MSIFRNKEKNVNMGKEYDDGGGVNETKDNRMREEIDNDEEFDYGKYKMDE